MTVANAHESETDFAVPSFRAVLFDLLDHLETARTRAGGAARERTGIRGITRRGVYDRDGRRCLWCGTPDHLTLDHVVPHSADGADRSDNLRTLCWDCNINRGNRKTDMLEARPVGVVEYCDGCLPEPDWEDRLEADRKPAWCLNCGLVSTTSSTSNYL